jgi:hypothetical protein
MRNKKRIRTALLAALKRDVAELVRKDDIDGLLETLSLTGYDTTKANVTSHGIGRAIVTIASLLVDDVARLAKVAHTATFHRYFFGYRDLEDSPQLRTSREYAEYRAAATLDKAGPGVLSRWLLEMNTEQADLENRAPTPSAAVH